MKYKSDSELRKNGIVYVIHAMGSDFYKIGWTKGRPEKRLKELQTGCPYELNIVKLYKGSEEDEDDLHCQFFNERYRGEWFKFSEEDVFEIFGYTKKHPENLYHQKIKRRDRRESFYFIIDL